MKNLRELSSGRYLVRQSLVALLAAMLALTAVPVSADTVPSGNGENIVRGSDGVTSPAASDSSGDSVGRNDDSGNDNSDSATTGPAATDSNGDSGSDNADSDTTSPAASDNSDTDEWIADQARNDDGVTSPAATGSDAGNSNEAGNATDSAAKTKSVSPADAVEQLILRVKTTSNNESYLVPTGGNVTGNQNFDWTINWGDGTTTQHTGARGASISHSYASAGTRNITIRPTDPNATGWAKVFGHTNEWFPFPFSSIRRWPFDETANRERLIGVMSPLTLKMTHTQAEINAKTRLDNVWSWTFFACTKLSQFSADFNLPQDLEAVGHSFCSYFMAADSSLTALPAGFSLPPNIRGTVGDDFAKYMFSETHLTSVPVGVTLPQGITAAGNDFASRMFIRVNGVHDFPTQLPQNLQSVGNNFMYQMFWECQGLNTLPANMTLAMPNLRTVGNGFCSDMFGRCTDLVALPAGFTMPQGTQLTTVGTGFARDMFRDCTALASLPTGFNLPQSIRTCGDGFAQGMFAKCGSLAFLSESFNLPPITQINGGGFAQQMFQDCTALNALSACFTMPPGVSASGDSFADNMFSGCNHLTSLPDGFMLPAAMTSVGNNFCYQMFLNCSLLETVSPDFNLPANIAGNVGDNFAAGMFQGCAKLTQPSPNSFFTFPHGIKRSGNGFAQDMFNGCVAMEYVNDGTAGNGDFTLPQTMAVVGDNFCSQMFYQCSKLDMPEKTGSFNLPLAVTGAGVGFGYRMFRDCTSLTEAGDIFSLPSGITALGNDFAREMFYNCDGLSNMNDGFTLPSSATSAGANVCQDMFNNCNNMTFVNTEFQLSPSLAGNVGANFCYQMFRDCTKLTAVSTPFTFPGNIAGCGNGFAQMMFYNCDMLTSMNAAFQLPEKQTSAAGQAYCYQMFAESGSLQKVNDIFIFPADIAGTVGDSFACQMFRNCTNLVGVGAAFTMPRAGITNFGANFAFQMFVGDNRLTSVNNKFNFPQPTAAATCGNNFAREMFSGCTKLTKVSDAFTMPQNLTTMGNDFASQMFVDCSGLNNMNAVFNMPQPQANASVGNSYGWMMFGNCQNLRKVNDVFTTTQRLTQIGGNFCYQMFSYCKKMPSVGKVFNLPQGPNDISCGDSFGYQLFQNCQALVRVNDDMNFTMPANMVSVARYFGKEMFKGCAGLSRASNSFNMPQRIAYGGHEFALEMFSGCTGLVTVSDTFTFPQLMTQAGNDFGTRMFQGCTKLTKLSDVCNLPQGITGSVGSQFAYQMFKGCTAMTEVSESFNLPQSMASTVGFSFAREMFYGCTALQYVSYDFTFPQGITGIVLDTSKNGYLAVDMFRNCNKLRAISRRGVFTMPQSLNMAAMGANNMNNMFTGAGGANFQLDADFRFPNVSSSLGVFYSTGSTGAAVTTPPQYPPGTAGPVDGQGNVDPYSRYSFAGVINFNNVFTGMDANTPLQNIYIWTILNGSLTPLYSSGNKAFDGCQNIFYDWWGIPQNWGGGGIAWEVTVAAVGAPPNEVPRGTPAEYTVEVKNASITGPALYDGPTSKFQENRGWCEGSPYDGRTGSIPTDANIYIRATQPGTFTVSEPAISGISDYELATDPATSLPMLVVKSGQQDGSTLAFGFRYNTTGAPLAGSKTHMEFRASLAGNNPTSGEFSYRQIGNDDNVSVTTYYDVVYHGNAAGSTGSPPEPDQHVKALTNKKLPANAGSLARAGYTFAGWTTVDRWAAATPTTAGAFYAKDSNYFLADQGDAVSDTAQIHFYADWSGNGYTLSFNANGGTAGTVTSKTVAYGAAVGTLPAAGSGAPTRTGYTFMGWSKNQGTSNTVNVGASTVWDTMDNGTYYAVWQGNSYMLYFDANGGTDLTITSKAVTYGVRVGWVPGPGAGAPTRIGHTFMGWGTTASAVMWNASQATIWNTLGDATWYAVFQPKLITLFLNRNTTDPGSTNSLPTNKMILYGEPYRDLPGVNGYLRGPTRIGYNFLGWSSVAGALTPNISYSTVMTATVDQQAYAVWQVTTNNTLTFNANGGTAGSLSSLTRLTYNSSYTIPSSSAVNPTRTGHVFQGWVTNAAISTPGAAGYQLFPSTGTVNWAGSMTLYAAWDINRYTVSFDVNNPAYSGAPIQAQTVESGSIAHQPESLSAGSMYTNYGNRKFLGWFVNLSDTAPYDFQRPVTANLTLHAKWEQFYRVEFANTHESQITPQYVPSGGRATRPSPDPTGPAGYTFHGWSASPNAFVITDTPGANSAPFDFAGTPITTDTAIYGVWSPDIWSIEFNANGGAFADRETAPKSAEYIPANAPPQSMGVGDPVRPYSFLASRDVPTGLARLGYSFTGWRGAPNGTGAQLPADGTVVTGNAVYYAIWQLETYDIDYDLAGGMAAYANPVTYRVTDHFPITFNAPQRTGYTFTGWTCDYEDTVETNPDDTTAPAIGFALTQGVTEDVALTAHWRANAYRVNYYGNGAGSGAMAVDTVNFGTAFTLKANAFARPGYSFLGWNTAADGSGKAYADRFSFVNGSSGQNTGVGWDLTSELSLFAQWEPATYTLTFDKNTSDEGACDASPTGRAVSFGSSIELLPGVGGYGAAPTRPGYVFMGWTYTPDGKSPDAQPADIYSVPTDSAVYAVWELPPPTYSFTRRAGAGGTVSGTPPGSYAAGTTISVRAVANKGYHFTGWTVNGVAIKGGSRANPATFSMPANAVALTASFAASGAAPTQIPNVTKIRTPLKTIYLTKGKSYKLAYVLDGPGGKPIDDPKLAFAVAKKGKAVSVQVSWAKKGSSGIYRVKAKKPGKSTITIRAQNGKSLKVKVVVQKKKTALKKFKAKLAKKLKKGKSYQIKLSKLTKKASDITAVTFKSSKKSVATVDAAGKVTALKKGKAKITIKVGKKKIVKKITVK